MRIAAIVVTHRGGALLDACLASLRAQTLPPAEILVVVSNAAALSIDAPALQLRANVGYARAVNAGVAATSGAPLVLNDDTRLDPGCLAALARAVAVHAAVDATPGPRRRAGGRCGGHAPRPPNAVYQPRILLADGSGHDNLGLGFFPDGAVWARGRGAAAVPTGAPGAFSGAAVLFERSTWNTLGGFDARLGSFGEDVDLSLRLMRRGVPIVPVPDAVVWHHLGASWGRASPEKLLAIERNRIRAAVRSLPLAALATLPAWTAARYAAFALLARDGRGPGGGVEHAAQRAALHGLVAGLRDAPEAWRDRRADRRRWTRGERAMWAALWAGRARWEDIAR